MSENCRVIIFFTVIDFCKACIFNLCKGYCVVHIHGSLLVLANTKPLYINTLTKTLNVLPNNSFRFSIYILQSIKITILLNTDNFYVCMFLYQLA